MEQTKDDGTNGELDATACRVCTRKKQADPSKI